MKAAARLLLVLALVAPTFASAQGQTLAPPAPPTCRLFASATIVAPNTKVWLDWSTARATSGYLTDVGAIGPNGSATVVPGKNTTYAASFSGPGGTIVCRVAVAVRAGGAGTDYGGGMVNIDGTSDLPGSALNINTDVPINTNAPVPVDRTVNLGGNVTLPTIPSFTPTTQSSGGLLGGIVPAECRGESTVANCDLCSLAQLGMNVANFLLGLTIPAAALLFAWAGILFFSSRGVPEQINRAKKIFMSVVIGFVIAVGAWVLVSTVMNMLIHGPDFAGWNWRELKCAETRQARLYDMSLSAYLTSSLPALQSYTGGSAISSGGCATGDTLTADDFCLSDSGTVYTPGSGSGGGSGSGYTLTAQQEDRYTKECAQNVTASCDILDLVGQATYGTDGACSAGFVYSEGSCYNPITQAISDPILLGGSGVVGGNYTSSQNVWLSACRQGDVASCQSFSASTGSGELGARIAAATQQYQGSDTSMGPGNGRVACAWAVNNILQQAGIVPIGGNTVESVERTLQNGRGTMVNTANAVPGDIIIWKNYSGVESHVGICQNAGCSSAISNSTSNARFTTVSGSTFIGQVGRVYHINN